MFAPLQPTPASPQPAYIPPRPWSRPAVAKATPAPPFFPPKPAPKPAAPAPAQAQPAPAPAPALLASVPEVLAPAVAALAHAAQQQAPYQLLAHALGHDPLTGKAVPAAPLALARTLVGLLPEGEARYQQLQAAGPALAHLPAWLAHQLAAHQLTGARLTQVQAQTWTQLHALGLRDALDPAAALARLTQPWLALGHDVARFVVRTEAALLRWLVTAVLGPDHAAPVLAALDQGGDLLPRILRHPLPFLTNLVVAGKRGFAAFLAHGPRHLLAAVQDWLLGGLVKTGLHLPAKLDVAGLIDLLLQVFDLTKAAVLHRLRLRLPTLPTERLQQVLTQAGDVALALWQHGPQAAWLAISAHAQGLRAQALDFVQQQVLGVAAQAVPLFLASLAVPGGAFLQLARGLYNSVMLFVEKGRQIAQVGQALFASAAAIAAGQLAPAAQAVENTLVKLLPVALNFLAKQLGLDGISGAIQTGLQKVRVPVEKAVNKVLDSVAQKANAIWDAAKTGVGQVVGKSKALATAAASKVAGWLGLRKPFTTPEKEQHTLFLDGTEADSRLMVASTPMPLLTYLRQAQRRTQALPEGNAKTTQLQLIEEAARLAGRHRVVVAGQAPAQLTARVVDELEQISQLLARIGGLPSGQAPLPDALPPHYQGPAAKESSRDRVSTRSSEQASNIPKTVKPAGWAELQGSGLTEDGNWVRMHLVSAKTGGLPVVQNLVVATRMANKRAEDFETQVKRLVEVPGDKPGVVWVRTYVTEFYPAGTDPVPYPAQAFPVQVHFTAGLYYYAPEAGQPAWRKDPQIRLATSVRGEVPQLSSTPRYLGGLGVPAIIAAVKLASGQEIPVRFAQDIRELYTEHHLTPGIPEILKAQLIRIGARTRSAKEQATYSQRVEALFVLVNAAINKTIQLTP